MRIRQMLRQINPALDKFIHTPKLITTSKLISPAAKLVYGTLIEYAPDYKDACWPGINTLAKNVGMDRTSVMRAITALEGVGLLSKTPRVDEKGTHSNLYTILDFPAVMVNDYKSLCGLSTEEDPEDTEEQVEADTPTYENHTTPSPDPTPPRRESPPPPSQDATRSIVLREVKDCQPAPSVPLASLATQTTRAGGVVPLGGAVAKPKSPPIDPNVVIAKIREAKDGAALTLESKECWTVGLAVWESLYGKKMSEADKRMFGNLIKDTSLELVGRTFVDLLDGDILPPDWPYIIQCVGNRRNKDAYKQVKKDTLPVHDYYEVEALDHRYGFGIYAKQYFKRIDDENGNPILNSQGHTQFQQLKPFPRFNE